MFYFFIQWPPALETVKLFDKFSSVVVGSRSVIFLWARQSELARGLEDRLFGVVKVWLATEWPFKSVALPSRDIAWSAWLAIPER